MKILLQRVDSASVVIGDVIVGEIGRGLLLLVGFGKVDLSSAELERMAGKVVNLRIFHDAEGRFSHSLVEQTSPALLIVPQFTLYARTTKGRRPDFTSAKEPGEASRLFDQFVDTIRRLYPQLKVASGQFGAAMKVSLVNDGPVSLVLESD